MNDFITGQMIVTSFLLVVIIAVVFTYIFISKEGKKYNGNTMFQETPTQDDSEIIALVNDRLSKNGDVSKEMAIIKAVLLKDREYAWSWYCNLVMTYVDCGCDKIIAMNGASRFLSILANVDISQDERFIEELDRLEKAKLDTGNYKIVQNRW